jgi:hypothetical protein
MLATLPAVLAAAGSPQTGKADSPIEETHIAGVITKVRIIPGGGPPLLEIRDDSSQTWTIILGAFHFLIREDFRPKAGQRVEVIAIHRNGLQAFARKVTLPEQGKTLILRDREGRPMWGPGGRSLSKTP